MMLGFGRRFKRRQLAGLIAVVLSGVGFFLEQKQLWASVVASSSSSKNADTTGVVSFLQFSNNNNNNNSSKKNEHDETVTFSTELSSSADNTTPTNVSLLDLSEQAIFFHIGKAGGGTIWLKRLEEYWRLKLPRCHPFPWTCGNKEKENEHKDKLTLLTLRDPVDRFVSAFYWAIIQGCDPQGDDRIPVEDTVWNQFKTHCSTVWNDSRDFQITYHKYGHDVNKLSAALCSPDESESAAAKEDLRMITHLTKNVAYWLKYHNTKKRNVFPIVLDSSVPGPEQQTDDFVTWMHNKTQFENAKSFSQRKARVRNLDASVAEQQDDNDKKMVSSITHSSHRKTDIALLPENEKCMIHFYRKEYDFFATIKDAMCKSSDCQTGIQSILDRRRRPLLHSDEQMEHKDEHSSLPPAEQTGAKGQQQQQEEERSLADDECDVSHCAGGRFLPNRIVAFSEPAGLGDRANLVRQLANVAGLLCARVIIPPPFKWLSQRHTNNGTPVSKDLVWDDFYTVHHFGDTTGQSATIVQNNNTTLRSIKKGWIKELDRHGFQAPAELQITTVAANSEDLLNDFNLVWRAFKKQQDQSHLSKKAFFWDLSEMGFSYAPMKHIGAEAQAKSQQKGFQRLFGNAASKKLAPRVPVIGDADSGCDYSHIDSSPRTLQVARQVLKNTFGNNEKIDSSTPFGLLHLRRGDSTWKCDTSVERIQQLISCSFNGTLAQEALQNPQKKFVMFLATDETDADYRTGVLDAMHEQLGCPAVDLDKAIEDAIRQLIESKQLPAYWDGENYLVFAVGVALKRDFGIGLNIEMRKSICPICSQTEVEEAFLNGRRGKARMPFHQVIPWEPKKKVKAAAVKGDTKAAVQQQTPLPVNNAQAGGGGGVFYSEARRDRMGAKLQDMLMAHAYAFQHNMTYGGACFHINNETYVDTANDLMDQMGLRGLGLKFACPANKSEAVHARLYRSNDTLIFTPEWRAYAKEQIDKEKGRGDNENNDTIKVVMHVRRGDVTPCYGLAFKYVPLSHHKRLLKHYVMERYGTSGKKIFIKIHSESIAYEPWNSTYRWIDADHEYFFNTTLPQGTANNFTHNVTIQLRLDAPLAEVWGDMAAADVFAMSKSSFSYVPALLNFHGEVLYTHFWHKPLKHWIWVDKRVRGPTPDEVDEMLKGCERGGKKKWMLEQFGGELHGGQL